MRKVVLISVLILVGLFLCGRYFLHELLVNDLTGTVRPDSNTPYAVQRKAYEDRLHFAKEEWDPSKPLQKLALTEYAHFLREHNDKEAAVIEAELAALSK